MITDEPGPRIVMVAVTYSFPICALFFASSSLPMAKHNIARISPVQQLLACRAWKMLESFTLPYFVVSSLWAEVGHGLEARRPCRRARLGDFHYAMIPPVEGTHDVCFGRRSTFWGRHAFTHYEIADHREPHAKDLPLSLLASSLNSKSCAMLSRLHEVGIRSTVFSYALR